MKLIARARPRGESASGCPRRRGAPRRDASLVAIGDDRTDEDLFRELAGRGLTIRIGRPGIVTAADHRLASPAAVLRFLLRLVDQERAASAAS